MLDRLMRFYTIKGRVSRPTYWRSTLYVGIFQIAVLFGLVFLGTAGVSNMVLIPVAILVGVTTFAYLITVAIRRLHDRNKGAVVWLLYLIVPNVTGFLAKSAGAPVLNVIAGIMALWIIIDIGFLAGTRGDNAYGPDPRRSAPSPLNTAGSPSLSTP